MSYLHIPLVPSLVRMVARLLSAQMCHISLRLSLQLIALWLLSFCFPLFASENQRRLHPVSCACVMHLHGLHSDCTFIWPAVCFARPARLTAVEIFFACRVWGHIGPVTWQHHGFCVEGYLWVIRWISKVYTPPVKIAGFCDVKKM